MTVGPPTAPGQAGLTLGAPGVYWAPPRQDSPTVEAVRLDVAGFVGVAPRGPVDTPVPVQSWDGYRRRFGSFRGPGRLPHAVAAFFAQGGTRAWIVRVGPAVSTDGDPAPAATAVHELDASVGTAAGPVRFAAAGEGAWGKGLTLTLGFDTAMQFPLPAANLLPGPGAPSGTFDERCWLVLPPTVSVPVGSLLLVRGPGALRRGLLCWVTEVGAQDLAGNVRRTTCALDPPVPALADTDTGLTVSVVTGTLSVQDPDPDFPQHERLERLGLAPAHPRWLGDVVPRESALVAPFGEWLSQRVQPATTLLEPARSTVRTSQPGVDRYAAITRDSFLDPNDPDLSPLDDRRWPGVDALTHPDSSSSADRAEPRQEIGLLCVPDLLFRHPADHGLSSGPARPDRRPGADFGPCEAPVSPVYSSAPGENTLLDAVDDLPEILARQHRLASRAEGTRRFVALLDVPPGLSVAAVSRWRATFDSSYVAAYHPWLFVAQDGGDGTGPRLVLVPPSAFATGIAAARERRLGVAWGPANELAKGVVGARSNSSPAERDRLHSLDVNVFSAERDGYRLSAGRTLSRDPQWRQLSVRRVMTMLRLSVERRLEWAVFEPNTATLRNVLTLQLTTFLRGLWQAGWLAGATEAESYFVRCDDTLNPPSVQDQGRLILEVGVAPAEPVEFIVLRVSLSDDRVTTEERR